MLPSGESEFMCYLVACIHTTEKGTFSSCDLKIRPVNLTIELDLGLDEPPCQMSRSNVILLDSHCQQTQTRTRLTDRTTWPLKW